MGKPGYIKVFRQIEEWEWVNDPVMFSFWVRILLLANWEDKRYQGEVVERGSFITTLGELSDKLSLSVQQVRTCLKRLVSNKQITCTSTNKHTKIIICKYESYQGISDDCEVALTNEQHALQQTNNKRATNAIYIEEDKEDKNTRSNIIPYGMCPTAPSDSETAKSDDKEILTNRHCQNIVDFWNKTVDETGSTLPKVSILTDDRKKKMRIRWKEFAKLGDPVEVCRTIFRNACTSKFCQGDNPRGWTADFDWLFVNGKNWPKVYEGKYDEKPVFQDPRGFRTATQGAGRVANAISTFNEVEQWIHNERFSDTPADGTPDSQFQQ